MAQDELGDTLPASDAPAAAAPDAQIRGATIGRYVVLGTLGAGGMGVVYAAYDPELDRRIALKLLRGRATDDTGRARIRREAQALARANHPNIVTVYDVGDHGDGVFIAMELVDGGTLRTWQARRPWREVLDAYVAAGRGLAAAHARGLVHRDFKPENVLVGADGRVRVTDFGLARLAEGSATDRPDVAPSSSAPPADSALTVDGAVMGTLGYMSPEQCDGSAVDARSDQYAWCVSAWEALYGNRPFRGATLLEIAGAMAGPPPDIPETPAIPRAIGRALLRGLAVDPDARWPAMAPLVDACAPRRGRRRRILAVGGAGAAVLGTAIAIAASRRPATEETCAPSARRLAGIWDGSRRDALARHFATSTRPDVATALGLATRDFDTYATTWSTQWDAACTSPERAHDPLLHAQRTNCLERTLVDLHGLVDAYLAVDPERFASSWRGNAFTIWQTPLADCERIASIRATPPAPLPEARDEITHLVIDMHRARVEARAIVNMNSGKESVDAPLARLDAIVTRLDALASPIAAEAAWWHATYAVMPGKRAASDRAMALARKYHNDRWLAFGYADVATTALETLHDPVAARRAVDDMDEAYERAGGDPTQFELHATVAAEEDRYADALDALRAARPARDALDHFGPDVAVEPEIRIELMQARVAEAVEAARHHVARLEAMWRGDHWVVADAHELLAHVLLYAHDPAGALAELHASLDMHARIASPPQRLQSARYLVLACTTLLGRDDERDAMARTLAALEGNDVYINALDLAVWAPGLVPWSVAHAPPGLELDTAASAAAYAVGDLATAERLAKRAPVSAATIEDAGGRFVVLAQLEARSGRAVDARLAALGHFRSSARPKDRELGVALEARILAARGSWPAVRALLEPVAFTTLHTGSHERVQLDALLGGALVETHEPARAIPVLERCLFRAYQIRFSYQNANELIADASFALARALWDSGGDRPRARALAALAIARYTSFETAQRAAAEAWLAAHAS